MKNTINFEGNIIPVDALDITGKVGDFHSEDAEWTMYSYSRPAYNFWNGIAKGMARQGATIKEIKWWLQSKNARWLLDSMDSEIESMGEKYGKSVELDELRETIKREEKVT